MDRHLLVTVSENKSFLHGAHFAANFFTPASGVRFTLLYIAPQAPDFWSDQDIKAQMIEAEKWTRKHDELVEQGLASARQIFLERGFSPESVRAVSRANRIGKVMEIALEAESGDYDAVVLGRRGLVRLEEFFEETVIGGMLDRQIEFPMWICRRPEFDRQGVLLCVDGSRPGLCAADHVGFMLEAEPRHGVTVAQVVRPGRRDFEDEQAVLDHAVKMLSANNIAPERVRTRIIESAHPAEAILAEAASGRYAAVAIGRTGAGRGLVRDMLFGSVSAKLARELTGAALWVCKYPCRI